ncbi:hypothetical protein NIES19_58190 (plasmid) [Anabaena cylindrica PCC 7122]|nr:hypothetical protein NIES19_58190 [Anabaena cylindrica PCC 7122]
MELLATVHWVGTQETNPAQDSEQAIELVHTWSDRKLTKLISKLILFTIIIKHIVF